VSRRDRLLPRSFYARPTLDVARDLLGKVLVHRSAEGTTAGAIVEAEAYIGEDDPACHAAPGPTARNQPLYGKPGYAYVYLNYGMHYLVNAVTEEEGHPAAVLLRALEPLEGIDLMRRRRDGSAGARGKRRAGAPGRTLADYELCRGPGNLTRAMGITLADNRADLCGDRLFIADRSIAVREIAWSRRVGIAVGTERPWRCYVAGSRAVSGRSYRPSTTASSRPA
jgi:DNA-3-methyladenine glycosylase